MAEAHDYFSVNYSFEKTASHAMKYSRMKNIEWW